MPLIDVLLPESLSALAALLLVVSAFFTSALTAAFGLGGGVALLAIMTQLMPVAVLIPVHGVVQLGSNASRAFLQRRHVQWQLMGAFLVGCVLGAAIGGTLFVSLPDSVIIIFVALFILWSVWGNLPPLRTSGRGLLFVGGTLATILTMFVGATGPFVMAILRRFDLGRSEIIGTQAAGMVVQHSLKVVAFGILGFAFGDWLPLMLVMVAATFLGTAAGTSLLRRLPEEGFRVGLKVIMTLIAIELLAEAIYDLAT